MKILIPLLLFLNLPCIIEAQEYRGVNFRQNFAESFELAKSEDKLIFLYFSGPNCEACDRLEKSFKNISISKLYNKHFVSFVLDAQGGGKDLAEEYGVYSFPTLMYLTEKNEIKYSARGFREGESIFEIGKLVRLSNRELAKRMDDKYKSNPEDTDHLYDYIEYLIVKEKFIKAEKLLKVYFDQRDKIEKSTWMNLALDFASDTDSYAHKLLIDEKNKFDKEFGENFTDRIIWNSLIYKVRQNYSLIPLARFERKFIDELNRAGYDPKSEGPILFFSEYLLDGVELVQSEMPSTNRSILTKYALAAIDIDDHIFNPEYLIALSVHLLTYNQNEDSLKKLNEVLEDNFAVKNHYQYLDLQSVALYILGNEDEALQKIIAARALAISQGENNYKPSINLFKKLGIVKKSDQ